LSADVTKSDWPCTVDEHKSVRIGLRYVRGLREEAGRAIAEQRVLTAFTSIDDLVRRVPLLRKDELRMLAKVGALNFINQVKRRDALWESERSKRRAGPLLEIARSHRASLAVSADDS
jgi:error-prone DNA polymerase